MHHPLLRKWTLLTIAIWCDSCGDLILAPHRFPKYFQHRRMENHRSNETYFCGLLGDLRLCSVYKFATFLRILYQHADLRSWLRLVGEPERNEPGDHQHTKDLYSRTARMIRHCWLQWQCWWWIALLGLRHVKACDKRSNVCEQAKQGWSPSDSQCAWPRLDAVNIALTVGISAVYMKQIARAKIVELNDGNSTRSCWMLGLPCLWIVRCFVRINWRFALNFGPANNPGD